MAAQPQQPGADSLPARTYKPLLKPGRHKLIGFARRSQGLIVARGNPLGIRVLNDLQRDGVRFVNRPLGTGTRVLLVGDDSRPWAPWTYLAPVAVRFAALDPASIRAGAGGIRQAQIMLVERRGQTVVVPQDFDCAGGRIKPARGEWTPSGPDDPAFAAVCEEGESDGRDPGDRG